MCKLCVEAVHEIFPEVPDGEMGDFLLATTCYPAGGPEQVRAQLSDNRAKMKTNDWHECYEIADREMDEAYQKMKQEEQEKDQ